MLINADGKRTELCHLLGEIYMQKATTYIRLHRKPSANILGLPGWWSRVKEKGATLKEGWSFLSTGLDVQRAMTEMEKRQERGEMGEEEMRRMEEELSGTLLLVAWKGSKFELSAVLRQVVDLGAFDFPLSLSFLFSCSPTDSSPSISRRSALEGVA